MFNNNNQLPAPSNKGLFLDSAQKFTSFLAIFLTFGLWPIAYATTEPFVSGFIERYYGYDWLETLKPLYGFLLAPLIFYACRASLLTSVMAGAIYVAQRYVV